MKNNWEIYFEINKSQYKSKYHWEKYKYLIFQGPQIQIQVQIYWYSKRQTQIWHFLDIWGLKYPKALVPKYICTQLCRSLPIMLDTFDFNWFPLNEIIGLRTKVNWKILKLNKSYVHKKFLDPPLAFSCKIWVLKFVPSVFIYVRNM